MEPQRKPITDGPGTLEKPRDNDESTSALPSHTLPGRSIEEDDVYSEGQADGQQQRQYNQDLDMAMDRERSDDR